MEGFDPVGNSPLKFRWLLFSVLPLFYRRAISARRLPKFRKDEPCHIHLYLIHRSPALS